MSETTGYKVADRVDHPEHGRGVVYSVSQTGITVWWVTGIGRKSVVQADELTATPKNAALTEDEAQMCLIVRGYESAEEAFARALQASAARQRGSRAPGLLPEDTPAAPVEEPKPQQLGLFETAAPVVRTYRRVARRGA
jgi:hypothetical protein